MNNSVAIIIVNWKTYELTESCLKSLEQVTYPAKEVIVVDNESTKEKLTALQDRFPNAHYLTSTTNLGFTGGNNLGIDYALKKDFEYILLLNNDTEVEPDFLEILIRTYALDKAIGAVQPKINFVHDKNLIWNAGGTFNYWTGFTSTIGYGEKDDGRYDLQLPMDWLSGCCILVPTPVVREIGMLDNRYFAYYEDVDWSFRIKKAGYQLIYQPASEIYHVAGASGKSKKKSKEGYQSPLLHYYNVRNHLFLLRTHLSYPLKLMVFIFQILKLGGYCIYFLARGRYQKLQYTLKGFREGFR